MIYWIVRVRLNLFICLKPVCVLRTGRQNLVYPVILSGFFQRAKVLPFF
jgi:hypothetical protein